VSDRPRGVTEAVRLTGADLPTRLLDLEEPPRELFVHGELPRGPAVAIVGTRHPTENARRFAYELAWRLSRAGVSVLSGGAKGIDLAAHEGAFDGSGRTVVVAPAAFDNPYPKEHAEFFERVVQRGGCYVSLVSSGESADRAGFFPRNRCLVALAHATVLVEAPLRSGARNAAAAARKLGRPLFVVPATPWNPRGRGCIEELKWGARVLLSEQDLYEELELQLLHRVPLPKRRRSAGKPLQLCLDLGDGSENAVLAAVAQGAGHPDEISDRAGLPAARVQALVLTLRLKGALVPGPDGRLRVAPPPPGPGKAPPR
jgi:DNA processing protein